MIKLISNSKKYFEIKFKIRMNQNRKPENLPAFAGKEG